MFVHLTSNSEARISNIITDDVRLKANVWAADESFPNEVCPKADMERAAGARGRAAGP